MSHRHIIWPEAEKFLREVKEAKLLCEIPLQEEEEEKMEEIAHDNDQPMEGVEVGSAAVARGTKRQPTRQKQLEAQKKTESWPKPCYAIRNPTYLKHSSYSYGLSLLSYAWAHYYKKQRLSVA